MVSNPLRKLRAKDGARRVRMDGGNDESIDREPCFPMSQNQGHGAPRFVRLEATKNNSRSFDSLRCTSVAQDDKSCCLAEVQRIVYAVWSSRMMPAPRGSKFMAEMRPLFSRRMVAHRLRPRPAVSPAAWAGMKGSNARAGWRKPGPEWAMRILTVSLSAVASTRTDFSGESLFSTASIANWRQYRTA